MGRKAVMYGFAFLPQHGQNVSGHEELKDFQMIRQSL